LAASGEQEALQRRHARYYVALVETLEPQSTGSQQSLWFERLEAEHHNLRAVLNWAFERDELELALRVAAAVWKFWQVHGYLSEGYAWLERILTQARAQHSRLRRPEGAQAYLKALWAGGWTAFVYSAFEQAERHFQEGEQLARQVGELRSLGLALHGRGAIARLRGKHDEADALYAESLPLFEQAGDQEHVAWTWHNFGITEWYRGNYAQALPPLEQGADLFRALGQRFALAESLRLLGGVARDLGDYSQAMQFYTEGLNLKILGTFEDHESYDGVMLGLPGFLYHLEFTSHRNGSPCPAPTPDNLLVLYIPEKAAITKMENQLKSLGYLAIEPENPYWKMHGLTFEDPDGWRVVLMHTSGIGK